MDGSLFTRHIFFHIFLYHERSYVATFLAVVLVAGYERVLVVEIGGAALWASQNCLRTGSFEHDNRMNLPTINSSDPGRAGLEVIRYKDMLRMDPPVGSYKSVSV
jgi:hypothetical protein